MLNKLVQDTLALWQVFVSYFDVIFCTNLYEIELLSIQCTKLVQEKTCTRKQVIYHHYYYYYCCHYC